MKNLLGTQLAAQRVEELLLWPNPGAFPASSGWTLGVESLNSLLTCSLLPGTFRINCFLL